MKILVTGANGLLGSAVGGSPAARPYLHATGRAPQPRCADATVYAQADLCDPQAVQALITDAAGRRHPLRLDGRGRRRAAGKSGAGIRHQRRRHENVAEACRARTAR
ncbi:MAG: hypothetical protein ACLTG4_00760 [Oscillospiraceae bacterium]